MRIAIVRKKYTFHGGAEGILHDLVMKLSAAGHEIHIFAIKWEGNDLPADVVFHKVPAFTFNSLLRDLTFAAFSFFMLKRQRKYFDIIQTHDKTLYQDICFVADGCHIEWLKQRWKRKGPAGKIFIMLNPYHWLILCIERIMYNGHKFKRIFALSDLVKRDILHHYRVSEENIDVVYHWIDTERFHPDNKERYRKEIRKQYSIGNDDFVILFVGSGFERKGLQYLIEAAELIPEPVTVLVVGKGPEKEYARIAKRQRVVFCGPQREVQKYFASTDLFVLPSMYEPLGIVYLEALASGLPVIATKSSGASDVIQDGVHGFVIKRPEDFEAIAGKIQLLISNRDQLRSMSKNARALAEEFTVEKHLGKIRQLYESIVN